MPEYVYQAVDGNGVRVNGQMSAENVLKLEDRLEEIGYWLIEAKEQNRQRKNKSGRVSRRELIDFFNGMAVLLEAGVNAADAIKSMIDETERESFKHLLEDVEINVQSGNTIHMSMSKYSKVFSEQVCNIIHAGEYGGNLAMTFRDLSEHLEWVDQVMGEVKQASIYPAMIVLAVVGLISLMFSFVVPKFMTIFESAGLELPALTRAIVTVGNYWLYAVSSVFLVIMIAFISTKYIPAVHMAFDKFKFKMPVFGSINKMLAISRFVHNLGLMVKSGVPILEALNLCRKLVGSPIMAAAIEEAEIAVHDGRRMSEVFRQHKVMSPLVIRMMVVGEETGNLEEALNHVSARYNAEVPRKIKRAFGILEPVIILILVGVVGTVAAAVFLPMFKLMSGING